MAGYLHSDANRVLCECLEQRRSELNLTQANLSARLGKPQSFVSKYERGERRLDVVEFVEIARELSLDIPKVLAQIESALNSHNT